MGSESQPDFNTYCAFCGVPFIRQMISKSPPPRIDSAPCHHCHQGIRPGNSLTCHTKYSPELLGRTSMGWLRRFHVLQLGPEPDGTSGVTTVSMWDAVGRAEGRFMARNEIGLWEHFYETTSYYGQRNGSIHAFPFHWCCYALFVDVLTESGDRPNVDMEILFRTMRDLTEPSVQALSLDYGDLAPKVRRNDGNKRLWENLPGEEFFVSHPTRHTRSLEESLRTRIAINHRRKPAAAAAAAPPPPPPAPIAEKNAPNDPFARLPRVVLDNIDAWLDDAESLLALGAASPGVRSALQNNDALWKRRILRSMPWFFEMRNIVDDADAMRGIDCQGLFTWLRASTAPRPFVEKMFLGVVNRRRIWKACEEFAGHYRRMEERMAEGLEGLVV